MPSLRQRVTTYFRQLSFIAEPNRDDVRLTNSLSPRNTPSDGCFITKYLEGQFHNALRNTSASEIIHGKEPSELPDLPLKPYDTGANSIIAACTGPDDGLASLQRSRVHLSAGPEIADIDFIDTQEEIERKGETTPTKHQNRYQLQVQHKMRVAAAAAAKAEAKAKPTTDLNSNKSTTSTMTHGREVEKKTINVVVRMISTKSVPVNGGEAETQIQQRNTDSLNKNIENSKENISPNDNSISEVISYVSNEAVAGVKNWKLENENAYGLSVSLYETNFITKEQAGSPIADCYGLVVRGNSSAMALADGVNWGDKAKIAARSAVQGSLEYLDTAVFGQVAGGMATSTREVFVSLLRSFWSAHAAILEMNGALSTLTVAVVLPLKGPQYTGKSVVCCCNVGDSLGYVYSKTYGVREFTQGSHNVDAMRDMRDALGALGPVDGDKPELSNLTLSLTICEAGDIVFLTSDGISDNFDPVVGKFAEPFTPGCEQTQPQSAPKPPHMPQLAPRRQNKSTSSMDSTSTTSRHSFPSGHQLQKSETQPIRPRRRSKHGQESNAAKAQSVNTTPALPPSLASSSRPKFLRSHTVIEPRSRPAKASAMKSSFPRSPAGLPLVTGAQRHALTLLRLEDLLYYGINGQLRPCPSARKLCHLLIDFARMISSAKRKMLEQRELFYKVVTAPLPPDPQTGHSSGVARKEVEMNRLQQRAARKRVVDGMTFSSLPGKLDHATVVAVTVTAHAEDSEVGTTFSETDF